MKSTKLALVAAAVAASALALAGCAGTDAASPTASGGTVDVVASTNVYGQIAEEVGGDQVTVHSIISSTSQDPHEFEATASDQLLVQRAQLLIENGGGYDPFLDSLVQAAGSTAPVVTAVEFSPAYKADHTSGADDGHDHVEGFNEHVFYDPATMKLVADQIAADLGQIDPANADTYTANAATFADGIATLQASLDQIKSAHAGQQVFVTEPLPLYLTEAAGLANATPEAFSEAVEEGQDVPPATLLDALGIIGSGDVKVVITNAQAAGAETTQVEDAAKAANVPVIAFSEILPDSTTYLGWMQDNIDALAKALG